ncbi:MAG: glycosyltransferase, partial [Gillisia sp.]
MHIGFLTPEYPHARVRHCAGIGSSLYNLVSALLQKNIQVSVFVYGQDQDFFIAEGALNLYGIKQKSYPFGGFYLYRKYLNRKISKIIDSRHIDLLEVPDWTGISAFMKFRIPVVMRFHGSDTYFCGLEERPQ